DKLTPREARELGISEDKMIVKPREKIIALQGEPLRVGGRQDEYWKLDRAVQQADGKPITITIAEANGQSTRQAQVQPHFLVPFNGPLSFAGMMPRAAIKSVDPSSSGKDKLQDGDAIVSMTIR